MVVFESGDPPSCHFSREHTQRTATFMAQWVSSINDRRHLIHQSYTHQDIGNICDETLTRSFLQLTAEASGGVNRSRSCGILLWFQTTVQQHLVPRLTLCLHDSDQTYTELSTYPSFYWQGCRTSHSTIAVPGKSRAKVVG